MKYVTFELMEEGRTPLDLWYWFLIFSKCRTIKLGLFMDRLLKNYKSTVLYNNMMAKQDTNIPKSTTKNVPLSLKKQKFLDG